ncbi:hypothetical protein [Bacteroides acidifaciens]|uniref:hypothetical protein n=1 Tax=Bacteroides acidifaciens TaxID=85831 RepID=UPI00263A4B49|nr:hypothetical protein [Bacteroides acidifaciens]
MAEITKIKPTPQDRPEDQWAVFRKSLVERFSTVINNRENSEDTVLYVGGRHKHDRDNLWNIFFLHLPEEGRSHYNCNSCRHFIQTYGTLVVMDKNGNKSSIMWDPKSVPKFFFEAVSKMKEYVEDLPISHIFIPHDTVLGFGNLTGEDGKDWTHFSLNVTWYMMKFGNYSGIRYHRTFKNYIVNNNDFVNEIQQDVNCIINDLEKYDIEVAKKALEMLESGRIYRSNTLVPACKWFIQMHEKTDGKTRNKATDLMFYEMATSKDKNHHIGSSVLGTLLDDIKDGKSFTVIKARVEEKLDPDNYMRSKSGPSASQIEDAEKLVAELGVAESLQRRYARLSDIPKNAWEWVDENPNDIKNVVVEKKDEEPAKTGGVFSSVTPVNKKPEQEKINPTQTVPAKTMSYETFKRKILPDVKRLYIKPKDNRFIGLTAPVNDDAPGIFKWDDNKIAWYYHGGVDMKRRVEDAGGKYENVWMRASLAWEGPTDLDIHCVFKSAAVDHFSGHPDRQDHIYYNSKSGHLNIGRLDVDANGGHVTSHEPVENIYFQREVPDGTYQFVVQNYEQRGMMGVPTPFTIELYVNGQTYTTKYEAQHDRMEKWTKTMFIVKKIGNNITVYDQAGQAISSKSDAVDTYVPVSGIMKSPNVWGGNATEEHRIFVVNRMTDPKPEESAGFFVEFLDRRFHNIRKTMEAFIKSTPVKENENGEQVCGYGYMVSSDGWDLNLRCEMNDGSVKSLVIDRAE